MAKLLASHRTELQGSSDTHSRTVTHAYARVELLNDILLGSNEAEVMEILGISHNPPHTPYQAYVATSADEDPRYAG